MVKDSRRGHGIWSGCHRFKDIICDGDSDIHEARNGGLKMGGTYWYFVRLSTASDRRPAKLRPVSHRWRRRISRSISAYYQCLSAIAWPDAQRSRSTLRHWPLRQPEQIILSIDIECRPNIEPRRSVSHTKASSQTKPGEAHYVS